MKTNDGSQADVSPRIEPHIFTLANGRKIHYLRRRGTGGRRIIFLHGFSGDAEGCRELIETLPAQYDVIVPDLPGFGSSDDPIFDSAGFKRVVEPLHELQRGCFGNEPAIIVGHSYGGMCAFYYASHYPDMAQGLMLFCPIIKYRFATRAASQFGMRLYQLLGLKRARKIYAARRFVDIQTWYLVRHASHRRYDRIKESRRREALAFRPSFLGMISLFDGFIKSADDLEHLVPTEIVVGIKDVIAHESSVQWYHKRSPKAKLTHIEGTHLFPVISPEATSEMIDAFARHHAS